MEIKLCEHCGTSQGIFQVHHKDRNPSNNSLDNRQVLCSGCHAKIHQPDRIQRINAEMKARRAVEQANYIDQSYSGWSKGMAWQELLDARQCRQGWG